MFLTDIHRSEGMAMFAGSRNCGSMWDDYNDYWDMFWEIYMYTIYYCLAIKQQYVENVWRKEDKTALSSYISECVSEHSMIKVNSSSRSLSPLCAYAIQSRPSHSIG